MSRTVWILESGDVYCAGRIIGVFSSAPSPESCVECSDRCGDTTSWERVPTNYGDTTLNRTWWDGYSLKYDVEKWMRLTEYPLEGDV